MGRRHWEDILDILGDRCWDEATELTSMIADDAYPSILRDDVMREFAAHTVVKLVQDQDYRRCLEALLSNTGGTCTPLPTDPTRIGPERGGV